MGKSTGAAHASLQKMSKKTHSNSKKNSNPEKKFYGRNSTDITPEEQMNNSIRLSSTTQQRLTSSGKTTQNMPLEIYNWNNNIHTNYKQQTKLW